MSNVLVLLVTEFNAANIRSQNAFVKGGGDFVDNFFKLHLVNFLFIFLHLFQTLSDYLVSQVLFYVPNSLRKEHKEDEKT
jgi:hypothetical protein